MVSPTVLIEPTLLTSAGVKLFTSPTGTFTVIKKITVTNIDNAGGHALSVWLVPNGTGSVANLTLLIDAKNIASLATLDVTEAVNHVLAPGDSIWMKGDDNTNLQARASGVEIV